MFNYHMNFVKHVAYFILITAWGLLSSCSSNKAIHTEELQIAVIADVHLQDVYGKLKDSDYRGIRNPENGNYALIRTMGSQLRSTRIFNENYFAFLTALDDIVRRKIKYVILPGDFSDDGQAVHIKGLKRILKPSPNIFKFQPFHQKIPFLSNQITVHLGYTLNRQYSY